MEKKIFKDLFLSLKASMLHSCCIIWGCNDQFCISLVCDQTFFPELKKEASDVAGCFSSRVRRLLRLHMAPGVQQYFISLRHCFVDDQQAMARECQMLMQYAVMNTTAMRKILKKYDKVRLFFGFVCVHSYTLLLFFLYEEISSCRFMALSREGILNLR